MNINKTIFIAGGHRGGRALTDSALIPFPKIKGSNELVIADPKENRALQLANIWKNKGYLAIGLKETCQDALKKFSPDVILLSIDQIKPMADILEKYMLPAQWQLLARGLGNNGPVVGLSGSIDVGNSEARTSSVRLINELSSFISPQSSMNIRKNLLNEDLLHSLRKRVSEHSVERLEILVGDQRGFQGGELSFFWGRKKYPLLVKEKRAENKWKEIMQLALDAELPRVLGNDRDFAVATVGEKNVDFFVIEPARRRRFVKFYMSLIHALPATIPQPVTQASSAVVTD